MKNAESNETTSCSQTASPLSRRRFLGGALAVAAVAPRLAGVPVGAAATPAAATKPPEFQRKIKLGLVGCGGRGSWLAELFQKHGGYVLHAVADYFPEVAGACGEKLGVDAARRFSTLSGYKRLIESGVEAVALETPPCFLPEQANAAVEAGLHVYMAKPVAVDVPGCLEIEAASGMATHMKRCFLVDYQMPTDPANSEVLQRIRAPDFGRIAQVATIGITAPFADPPKTKTIESRLRKLVWVNDVAIGGDYIVNFDIHAIDAAIWVLGRRPVAAQGASRIVRPDPHGDGRDVCSVIFEYEDGLVHNHYGQALRNQSPSELSCRIHGLNGNALIHYWGKAQVKTFDDGFNGDVVNLYEAGASRNIASFYQEITTGGHGNKTARRAVDGALTCILGREAAARHTRLTMAQLLKENKRIEADLQGLKT